MLMSMLGNRSDILSLKNEGTFFEHRDRLETLSGQPMARRVAQIIESGTERFEFPRASLNDHLRQYLRQIERKAKADELYQRGMQWLTRWHESKRWAQKATSYVFYVAAVLEAIPEARLLFLARNPLDIAASLKRRGEWQRALRMVWGWNRGTAAAVKWTKADPERVRLFRYEDLVQAPRETMREICSFADLEFKDDLLEVPHVNRSETPYNQESDTAGINASRVHYYSDVLSPEEEATVRAWTSTELLERCYPDLPTARASYDTTARVLTTVQALGAGAQTILVDHAGSLVSKSRHVFDRIRRRLG
jgi:hypothetical protein